MADTVNDDEVVWDRVELDKAPDGCAGYRFKGCTLYFAMDILRAPFLYFKTEQGF